MTLEEQMNDILFEMGKGELFAISSGTPNIKKLAIKKLVSLGLIEPRRNTYHLTKSGYEAITLGSVNKWCTIDKEPKNISNVINVHGDANNSQLGVSSSFGYLESKKSLIEIDTHETAKNNTNKIKSDKLSIWSKIYKWTDHKLISIIIGAILGFIATKVLYYFGWINCQ